ncbi:MAG: type I methionyl aminopeptidase [Anaerolineae bacterium]|nr:type I methionyl aminopeptidase [Anaerolineae bacterium]MCO5206680.1 type I methionyl aminopeptidase [Anaerolineae bacterium]
MSKGRLKLRRRKTGGVILKSQSEIAAMKEAGQLVAESFALLQESIEPGMRLSALDGMVEDYIRSRGALPLYKGYRGSQETHPPFPGTICASINEEICHGIPDDRRLRKGDIIGIDIGLRLGEFCGDACVTFAVGTVSAEADRLLTIAKECMWQGIEASQIGNRLGDIGQAIQNHAEAHGYSVVKEWGGHGIGRDLHESPSVPHNGPAEYGMRLRPGMVFTVEPMINAGSADCHLTADGWTVVTNDNQLSAQFEHTIAITTNGPEVLSPWHELI